MAGYYSMNKKSACIDFRTNLENSLEGHNQLVDSNERLISFNYQNLQGKLPIFPQNFWFKLSTGLAWMPGYNDMKQTQTRMGGEPTAISNITLGRAAEISVFFLQDENYEVATILKGGKKK